MDDYDDLNSDRLRKKAYELLLDHHTAIVNALQVHAERLSSVLTEADLTYPAAGIVLREEAEKSRKIAEKIRELMGTE